MGQEQGDIAACGRAHAVRLNLPGQRVIHTAASVWAARDAKNFRLRGCGTRGAAPFRTEKPPRGIPRLRPEKIEVLP